MARTRHVYPALHRLERDGLVASRWSVEAPRRRRVYELTLDGEEVLAGKRTEWRRFADGVLAVLSPAHRLQWSPR